MDNAEKRSGPNTGNSGTEDKDGKGGKDQPEQLHIFVNRRKFVEGDGVHAMMTGGQIAALVDVPPANAIIRLENGPGQGQIGITESVHIKNGMHFLVTREVVEGGHES